MSRRRPLRHPAHRQRRMRFAWTRRRRLSRSACAVAAADFSDALERWWRALRTPGESPRNCRSAAAGCVPRLRTRRGDRAAPASAAERRSHGGAGDSHAGGMDPRPPQRAAPGWSPKPGLRIAARALRRGRARLGEAGGAAGRSRRPPRDRRRSRSQRRIRRDFWCSVGRALDYIAAGDVYQANLSRAMARPSAAAHRSGRAVRGACAPPIRARSRRCCATAISP